MQSVNNASTPSPAFNVAGPNKRTIAEGAWNVGTVNAVNADELAVVSDTLQFINGPTVPVTSATHPLVVQGNTATPAALPTGTVMDIIGQTGTQARVTFDGVAAPGSFTFRRTDTSLSSPSALLFGDQIGAVSFQGYGATGYSSGNRAQMAVNAADNWTDTDQGTYFQWSTTKNGGTAQAVVMSLLNSGEVAIGASLTSPNLSTGNGVPSATEPKGSIYMRTDGSIGANVYISNGSGTWSAIALV